MKHNLAVECAAVGIITVVIGFLLLQVISMVTKSEIDYYTWPLWGIAFFAAVVIVHAISSISGLQKKFIGCACQQGHEDGHNQEVHDEEEDQDEEENDLTPQKAQKTHDFTFASTIPKPQSMNNTISMIKPHPTSTSPASNAMAVPSNPKVLSF